MLVTGAATGIGLACTRRFLDEGAQVAMVDRDAERLSSARESLAPSDRAFAMTFDVTDGAALREGVPEAARRMGGIDGVVNNAGIDLHRPFADVEASDWNEVMAVNLVGAMEVCRAALDPLAASGRGVIVNVASAAGLRPIPGRVAYCASKAALIMATKALALELAEQGIRANAVCPGAVDTDLFRASLGGRIDGGRCEVALRAAPNRGGGGNRRRSRLPALGRGILHHGLGPRGRRRSCLSLKAPRSEEGPRRRAGVRPMLGP